MKSLQDCYKVPAGGPDFQVKITGMSSRLLKYIPEQAVYSFYKCIMSPLKVLVDFYVTRKSLIRHRLLVMIIFVIVFVIVIAIIISSFSMLLTFIFLVFINLFYFCIYQIFLNFKHMTRSNIVQSWQ